MIECSDSLEFLKRQDDFSADIIYADVPYNLGSEIIVRQDGKMDYGKKTDFMNKWPAPDGVYWEKWYQECFRVLKHGGYTIVFSIDRQCALPKYYASLAGFSERQSLYWFFISNFPKSSDLSKMIDRNFGVEREVVKENPNKKGRKYDSKGGFGSATLTDDGVNEGIFLTTPSTSLAKKYSGYKYSCSPLKQTNETIMVFQKPYKTSSCLHDTLAYEGGDKECCCAAFNIDGGRVPTSEKYNYPNGAGGNSFSVGKRVDGTRTEPFENNPLGRYPVQTFITSEPDGGTAAILDKQSGISFSRGGKTGGGINFGKDKQISTTDDPGFGDTGGCSKVLHKCDFEFEEHDLYLYCPKVGKSERNAGLEGFEDKKFKSDVPVPERAERPFNPIKNPMPCLKPISLNYRILKLFKTPNPQKILYPFAGTASEVIGGLKAGFTDWEGCEINEEYIKIGEARIKYWTEKFKDEKRQDILI